MGQQQALMQTCQPARRTYQVLTANQNRTYNNKRVEHQGILILRTVPFKNCVQVDANSGAGLNEPLFLQNIEITLKDLLQSRLYTNKLFPIQNIERLIQNVTYTLAFLQQNNIVYKDITTENIFYNAEDGNFKILPNELIPHSNVYNKFLIISNNGVSVAGSGSSGSNNNPNPNSPFIPLSPQMIIAHRCQQKKVNDTQILHKSNVFYLGLIFLESAVLLPSSECYDTDTLQILDQIVTERLQLVKEYYNEQIAGIVANFLDYDYVQRMDLKQAAIYVNRQIGSSCNASVRDKDNINADIDQIEVENKQNVQSTQIVNRMNNNDNHNIQQDGGNGCDDGNDEYLNKQQQYQDQGLDEQFCQVEENITNITNVKNVSKNQKKTNTKVTSNKNVTNRNRNQQKIAIVDDEQQSKPLPETQFSENQNQTTNKVKQKTKNQNGNTTNQLMTLSQIRRKNKTNQIYITNSNKSAEEQQQCYQLCPKQERNKIYLNKNHNSNGTSASRENIKPQQHNQHHYQQSFPSPSSSYSQRYLEQVGAGVLRQVDSNYPQQHQQHFSRGLNPSMPFKPSTFTHQRHLNENLSSSNQFNKHVGGNKYPLASQQQPSSSERYKKNSDYLGYKARPQLGAINSSYNRATIASSRSRQNRENDSFDLGSGVYGQFNEKVIEKSLAAYKYSYQQQDSLQQPHQSSASQSLQLQLQRPPKPSYPHLLKKSQQSQSQNKILNKHLHQEHYGHHQEQLHFNENSFSDSADFGGGIRSNSFNSNFIQPQQNHQTSKFNNPSSSPSHNDDNSLCRIKCEIEKSRRLIQEFKNTSVADSNSPYRQKNNIRNNAGDGY